MLNTTEMRDELLKYKKSPALFLPPWVLAWLVWLKNTSDETTFDIPVVSLYDFSDPNEIPEGKDCPFAIDGERYYFTKLVPRDASGNRSKRQAGEQGAHWKSTSPDINITDLHSGNLIGYMRKYTLPNASNKKQNWLMEEYRVPDRHDLRDPYVLCKIYDKESVFPGLTDVSIRSLTNRAIERERKRGSQPDETNSKFGNLSPSTSTPKNPLQNIPPNSLPIPRPYDAPGNQNHPVSIPWNSILSPTPPDNYSFGEDLQPRWTTSETFLFESTLPTSPWSAFSSNELLPMIDPSFSGPSMPAPDGEESPADLWNH